VNLRDFPSRTVADAGCTVVHPDAAIAAVVGAHARRVGRVVDSVQGKLRHPPMSKEAYLSRLEQRAPTGAKALRAALEPSARIAVAPPRTSLRRSAWLTRSSPASGLAR